MSRQTIKDANYRILGYIDTRSDGEQVAKDAHYRVVGYFRPATGATKDANYRIVGHGNLLPALIHKARP